jgi:hypothetical protein
MPPIETIHRHDPVIYWPRSTTAYGQDDYGNETVSRTYSEIYVRWEEQRGEVRDSFTGQLVEYDVVCVVAAEIEKGSVLWKGTEEEWEDAIGTAGTSDDAVGDLMVVVERGHIEDIKGRHVRRVLYLRRKDSRDPSA